MMRRLPVTLPPVSDELLSSWIYRHAAFYAVPPLVMLRHCLPEATSLRAADLNLSDDQAIRLAEMFSTDPAAVRRMTFGNVRKSAHRFVAAKPTQHCTSCNPSAPEPAPVLRSQLLGWRITCPLCGNQYRESGHGERASPFRRYRIATPRGEKLLDDDAERGIRSWTSPLELAQLLLMRRIPWPLPREGDLWRFRILGIIIPDLDNAIANENAILPTPARPIPPLHLRSALSAGVAIVERAGPEMLKMLRGQTIGENRVRFTEAAEIMIAQSPRSETPTQMHLI